MDRILLASASPRRAELLRAAGVAFDLFAPEIDESLRDCEEPADRVLGLAEDKARAAALLSPSSSPRLALGADTLVCLPGQLAGEAEVALGKPANRAEAGRMMRLISGRPHLVRTGLALLDRSTGRVTLSRSDSTVSFSQMSEGEIEAYLDAGEWAGVAGGYRIQGLAALFIDRLEGSWSGVVGLPMRELYVMLLAAGYRVPPRPSTGG